MLIRPEIRAASTPDELEAIYKFRYEIYVSEMAGKQKFADHEMRMIRDALDQISWNIAAWDGSRVVACIQLTWLSSAPIPYLSYYHCCPVNHRINSIGYNM